MFLLLALSFFSTFIALRGGEDKVYYNVVLNEDACIPPFGKLVSDITYSIIKHSHQKSLLTLTEVNKSFRDAFTIELHRDVRCFDPKIVLLTSGRIQLHGCLTRPDEAFLDADNSQLEKFCAVLSKQKKVALYPLLEFYKNELSNKDNQRIPYALYGCFYTLDKGWHVSAVEVTKEKYKDTKKKCNDVLIAIIRSLKNNQKLTSFTYIVSNDWDSKIYRATDSMATAIEQNLTSIKQLKLKNVAFGKITGHILISFFSNHSSLEKLKLEECIFSEETVGNLLEALRHSSKLKSLSLDGTFLSKTPTEKIADHLSEIINHNTNLTSLSIATMGLKNHTSVIIKALYKNSTLTKLSLGNNFLKDARDLNKLVQHNSTIKKLDLDAFFNPDAIDMDLLNVLSENVTLTKLSIGYHSIDTPTAEKIYNIGSNHPTLRILKCEKMYQDATILNDNKAIEDITKLLTSHPKIQFSFADDSESAE